MIISTSGNGRLISLRLCLAKPGIPKTCQCECHECSIEYSTFTCYPNDPVRNIA